jgi:hypothetical protein
MSEMILLKCPNPDCGEPMSTGIAWPTDPSRNEYVAERARRLCGAKPYCDRCKQGATWIDWTVIPRRANEAPA